MVKRRSQSLCPRRRQEGLLISLLALFISYRTSTSATAFVVPVQRPPPALSNSRALATTSDGTNGTAREKIPFIVEKLPKKPNPAIFQEVASMCIAAFFNDGKPGRPIPPWKQVQLGYLKTLQQNDLRRRRANKPDANFMLVARRVKPADACAVRSTPLILDLSAVHNLEASSSSFDDYVRGEVVGFVEVTQKPYGLGRTETFDYAEEHSDDVGEVPPSTSGCQTRPILTNLSVVYEARRSGVGSKLVQRCEEEVIRLWNKHEIVLEVEEDNLQALAFYKKRGYKVLLEDPTSRRYDASGLWLQQKRCKRFIMRKLLGNTAAITQATQDVKLTLGKGMETLRKFRETVFS